MQETEAQSLGWKDFPGGGNDNPLQYSCLENLADRGAWRGTDHGIAESDTTERLTLPPFHISGFLKVESF